MFRRGPRPKCPPLAQKRAQARPEQLESDLVRAWRNDPVAQAETLRSEAVPEGARQ